MNARVRGGLRGQILRRVLPLALVPMLVVGALSWYGLARVANSSADALDSSRTALLDSLVGDRVRRQASTVARESENFIAERASDLDVLVSAPVVVTAARDAYAAHASAGFAALGIEALEGRFELRKSLDLAPAADQFLRRQIEGSGHFGEAFFTDANGFNVALTNATSDFVQSDETWWKRAWNDGAFIGEVEFDSSANLWSVDMARRIDDPADGTRLGVLKAVLNIAAVHAIADRNTQLGARVTIAEAGGRLIAETSSGHARDRIMNDSVNLRRTDSSLAVAFGAERSGFHTEAPWLTGFDRVGSGSGRGAALDWVVAVQLPLSAALSPLRELEDQQTELGAARDSILTWLVIAGLVTMGVAVFVAQLIARGITRPVQQLGSFAENVSLGDTATPIRVEADNEIGDLAESLERMRRSLNLADKLFGFRTGGGASAASGTVTATETVTRGG